MVASTLLSFFILLLFISALNPKPINNLPLILPVVDYNLVPLWPLTGPGDVVLQPRLYWIQKQRSEGSRQRPQDWNLSSVPQANFLSLTHLPFVMLHVISKSPHLVQLDSVISSCLWLLDLCQKPGSWVWVAMLPKAVLSWKCLELLNSTCCRLSVEKQLRCPSVPFSHMKGKY